VSLRLNYIRLRNKQHELYERSYQLIHYHNRHLHRNGWLVHADDGYVSSALKTENNVRYMLDG
jgi:hypothetical protein